MTSQQERVVRTLCRVCGICCGIEDAITRLNDESNASRRRHIVVMSDGEANVRCHTATMDLNGDGPILRAIN